MVKLDLVCREKMSSSEIVLLRPWLVRPGEYLYSGGVWEDGIAVATSGARGWADEAISSIILSCIQMLARLKAEELKK